MAEEQDEYEDEDEHGEEYHNAQGHGNRRVPPQSQWSFKESPAGVAIAFWSEALLLVDWEGRLMLTGGRLCGPPDQVHDGNGPESAATVVEEDEDRGDNIRMRRYEAPASGRRL
jgi:hypothetical protein